MLNTKKWAVQLRVPYDAPKEYKHHALESARRRAGVELFDLLYKDKLPAVVDIQEEIQQYPGADAYSYLMPDEEIRITISVTPVEHRHVVVQSYEPVDFKPVSATSNTRWQAFVRFLKSLIGR